MHFLEKFNIYFCWPLAAVVYLVMCAFPGSPFISWMFIPVVLCAVFPAFRLQLVFASTLFFGLFIMGNFFSTHIYGSDVLNPFQIILPLVHSLTYSKTQMAAMMLVGVAGYVLLFTVLFYAFKNWRPKFDFFTSTALVLFFFFLSWLSTFWISADNLPSVILALVVVMFSRHCFYLYNYLLFFKKRPENSRQAFAYFQPFWFLSFEVPENPDYEITETDRLLKSGLAILLSCLFFKIALTLFSSLLIYSFKGQWMLIYDAGQMETEFFFPILKEWRSQNVFVLLLLQFAYALSYLVSNFFIYGRVMVALARFCGFNLPDYIDAPWKSHSFADFFSRTMYYYNIIIVNHFMYPALEFTRKITTSKKWRLFLALNWALIFGGFFARYMKDIFRIYKSGFVPTIHFMAQTSLFYLISLSLLVTLSLLFQKRVRDEKNRFGQMFFYIFLYSLIMPFNYSRLFGGAAGDIGGFYLKIFSLGLIQ